MTETTAMTTAELPAAARDSLRTVLERLESGRGLVVRLADLMGGALGRATRMGARSLGVPGPLQSRMRGVAEAALARAYDVAILGLGLTETDPRRAGLLRRAAVMVSGAAGGFVGMAGFLPDATITTLSIMREIAAIARQEGEDLSSPGARRACLEVFALRSPDDEAAEAGESELGYFSARLLMQGRPMVMLMSEIAARYGVTLSQKFALQAVPIAGALTGAALNAAFLAHYRDVARAHFTIRRLERQHGAGTVQDAAQAIRAAIAGG
jgi:hypothetical protein